MKPFHQWLSEQYENEKPSEENIESVTHMKAYVFDTNGTLREEQLTEYAKTTIAAWTELNAQVIEDELEPEQHTCSPKYVSPTGLNELQLRWELACVRWCLPEHLLDNNIEPCEFMNTFIADDDIGTLISDKMAVLWLQTEFGQKEIDFILELGEKIKSGWTPEKDKSCED
jgi:hypothetical protein